MLLINGIALLIFAGAIFRFSLPRAGRSAEFVGTQWEPYVTILIIAGIRSWRTAHSIGSCLIPEYPGGELKRMQRKNSFWGAVWPFALLVAMFCLGLLGAYLHTQNN